MTAFHTLLGVLAIFGLVALWLACLWYAFREGEELGYRRGYDEGRREEAGWWAGIEVEADRERQKIWREER